MIQKEIIHKQDELHQLRKQERDAETARKLEATKREQHEQQKALQAVAKLSLGEGKKKRSKPNRKKALQGQSLSDKLERKPARVALGDRQLTHISEISTHSSLASVQLQAPPTPIGAVSLLAEEDEEFALSDEEEEEPGEEVLLPWHHEQLYRMYGKDADYFLHPKIEQEKKVVIKHMNPMLRKQGQAGARELWSTLRNDSRMKLLQEDATIPFELKHAYSSFMRQLLNRRKMPVKRNFYSEEDVPEIDRLMNQSRIHATHNYKHKVELMFRSSRTNEDRTGVVTFNNPLPDLNNWQGEESVMRYIPSWSPQPESSPPEYSKWLTPRAQEEMEGITTSVEPAADNALPTKKTRGQIRVHFLTEKEASVPGEFRKRMKEARQTDLEGMAHYAVQSPSDHDNVRLSGSVTPEPWQPLTSNALEEYKTSKPVKGQGQFTQGAKVLWSTKSC